MIEFKCEICNKIIKCNIDKKDYPSAFKYYNRSLDVSKQLGDSDEVIVKTIDLSNAYMFAGEHDNALGAAKEALSMARQDEKHLLVLNCLNQISDVYFKKGEKWKAHEYYIRFSHYRDSVEGEAWDLNSMLAQEKIKFKSEEQEEVKTVYNMLADKVETVTPFLVENVLRNDKTGTKIDWLTPEKANARFEDEKYLTRDLLGEFGF